jgi:septal ring factor EnvC (AmiA/AmiB activator)
MVDTRRGSEIDPVETGRRSSETSEKKKKVEIQINAISTPKGDVPTVDSLKNVVAGLNLLDSELSLATEEAEKTVLSKIKDLEKEIVSIKRLISETAISFEATLEKLNEIEPRLEKTYEIVESQKAESAELARYMGAVTNTLRRELVDYINLFEKRLSEEIKRSSRNELPELKELSGRFDKMQKYLDKLAADHFQTAQETNKSVEGLRTNFKDLTKVLNDLLNSFSSKLEEPSETSLNRQKTVRKSREHNVNPTEEIKEAELDASMPPNGEDSDNHEKETGRTDQKQ